MCTIEKANVTINRLIAEGRLGAHAEINLAVHSAVCRHLQAQPSNQLEGGCCSRMVCQWLLSLA